ncbi:hypothetical protein ACU4HD_00665 [Cupriavidus basilensis]
MHRVLADHLLRAIGEAQGEAFDAAWMQSTFDAFWQASASYTTAFTNLLLEPPGEAVMHVLGAASQNRAIADEFVGCFEAPSHFLAVDRRCWRGAPLRFRQDGKCSLAIHPLMATWWPMRRSRMQRCAARWAVFRPV